MDVDWIRLRPELARLLVPEGSVEQARRELISLDRPEGAALLDAFLFSQPHLTSVVYGWTDNLSEAAQGLAFFLSLLCWRAFVLWKGHEGEVICWERIVELLERREAHLNSLEGMDSRMVERHIRHSGEIRQLHLMRVVAEELEGGPRAVRLAEEERKRLLLMLLLVMDCLEEAFGDQGDEELSISCP